ncbi:hypothetical protein ACHHYP_11696 [Achlya hypogyna]|uniref:CCHC-type domain-containing protein n=1 Tax=Achlya hypogyna TaxID=1202772 RepID=A0A1V9YII5_ACHHY|nr:hypothetical protein ACHHYP_11696 [Achlya hypogyna]
MTATRSNDGAGALIGLYYSLERTEQQLARPAHLAALWAADMTAAEAADALHLVALQLGFGDDGLPCPASEWREACVALALLTIAGPAWRAAFAGKTAHEACTEFQARARAHAQRDGPGAMMPTDHDPEAYVPSPEVRRTFPGCDRWATLGPAVKLCQTVEQRSRGSQPDPEPGLDHAYAEIRSPGRDTDDGQFQCTAEVHDDSDYGLHHPLLASRTHEAQRPPQSPGTDRTPTTPPPTSRRPSREVTRTEVPEDRTLQGPVATAVVFETLAMVRDMLVQMRGEPGHCGLIQLESLEAPETNWLNNILARERWEITELTHAQWTTLVELFYDRFVGNSAARSRLFDSIAQHFNEKTGFERVVDYLLRVTAFARVAGREDQDRLLIDKAVDGIRDPALAIAVLPHADLLSWAEFERQLTRTASRLKTGLLGPVTPAQQAYVNAVDDNIASDEDAPAQISVVQYAQTQQQLMRNQRRGPARQPTEYQAQIQCYDCAGYGHVRRFCPNRTQHTARGDCAFHGPNVGHTDAECSALAHIRRNPSAAQAIAATATQTTTLACNMEQPNTNGSVPSPAGPASEESATAPGFGGGRQ